MDRIEIHLYAVRNQLSLELSSPNPNFGFVKLDLLSIFSTIDYESNSININQHQQNTPDLRNRIEEFISKYSSHAIQVFQLRTFIQTLKPDEHFLVFPFNNMQEDHRMIAFNFLTAHNEGKDFSTLNDQLDGLYKDLKAQYEVMVFDERCKTSIGEQNKQNRVCRFCGKSMPEVSFKKKAHAISESLGNRAIILNEECDTCNERFGKGIELDLFDYLNLYSNIFRIPGKEGIAKMKGKNFELEGAENLVIKIDDQTMREFIPSGTQTLKLETHKKVSLQNIYRVLCKFAISVLPSDQLDRFTETIRWVNQERSLNNLPKVAFLTSYAMFTSKHPSILLYIRKSDDQTLPFLVAEFHYTFLSFVYIVPSSSKDTIDFTIDSNYERFWSFFKHFSFQKDWLFREMNDDIKRNFDIKLNFKFPAMPLQAVYIPDQNYESLQAGHPTKDHHIHFPGDPTIKVGDVIEVWNESGTKHRLGKVIAIRPVESLPANPPVFAIDITGV